jgi:DNA-binding transcriptional LysR family regulator
VLVASPEYLSRKGEPARPQDLAQHDCIVALSHSGEHYGWNFRLAAQGRARRSGSYVHYPQGRLVVSKLLDTVVDAALMGLGITIAFVESVLPHLESGRLRILLPAFQLDDNESKDAEIFIQYPHRKYVSLKVRALVDFLLDRFRAYEKLDYSPATLKRRFEGRRRRSAAANRSTVRAAKKTASSDSTVPTPRPDGRARLA